MPSPTDTEGPTARGDSGPAGGVTRIGRAVVDTRVRGVTALSTGRAGRSGALPVTVVSRDAERRRRLIALLSGVAGIEVVGWADTPGALSALGAVELVVGSEPVRPHGIVSQRPDLAPRQRDVLVAYAAGNELLRVAARKLGMSPESFKTHLRRIRDKYRAVGRAAPTRRDLYERAVQDGLLPPPS